ncbi:hypothetical protein Pan44_53870 [Caulifigura coniformis]|uniref:Uncharacterized protein n=1 Tax=Caulifigura coniformis TaxID=2527983 RepID=A0A517SMG8_9PLAN|nr:hypothetical protein Pan44_53870 [Caulifigura coniformis]
MTEDRAKPAPVRTDYELFVLVNIQTVIPERLLAGGE